MFSFFILKTCNLDDSLKGVPIIGIYVVSKNYHNNKKRTKYLKNAVY